jgi:oxygen-independent coproporphyrinogen-3 oxidase
MNHPDPKTPRPVRNPRAGSLLARVGDAAPSHIEGGREEGTAARSARPDPAQGTIDVTRALGLYVHVPFCSVRCPYCDFAVDTRTPIPHQAYGDAVVGEIEVRAPWFKGPGGPRLRSIYFGGGTPALWRPEDIGRVIAAGAAGFAVRDPATLEITVEANPSDLDRAHLDALLRAGVGRLSLGLQAFDDTTLARLGRNHDGAAAVAGYRVARAAGFSRLSCDLMFGVPGDSAARFGEALARLVDLGPEHISCYALTVERGTTFFNLEKAGRLHRPPDDLTAELFLLADETLAAAGYEHYEISSYARPGSRAVHNSLYWSMDAYLGVGASASSFRPLADGSGCRFSNPRSLTTYLRAGRDVRPARCEARNPADLREEALWLALRTRDGVDRQAFRDRFGTDPLVSDARQRAVRACVAAGWLEADGRSLRLTRQGMLFADEVAGRLWAA